jgi:hypothetical protein
VQPDYPKLNNYEYHFAPRPMEPIPPIRDHEFASHLRACYEPGRHLHWFSECRRPCSSAGVLQLIPQRRQALQSGGEPRVEFWGIYARERISAFRVAVYVLICLAPSILFFFIWIFTLGIDFGSSNGQDDGTEKGTRKPSVDLQNASVPLTITIGLLGLLWCLVFLNKDNQMAALR